MTPSGKCIAIVQSNYVPWKGYFDLIASVDEFILYDDAQYTKRDWRNRNLIKTAGGVRWLTIPVEVKGKFHQRIRDVVVSDRDWPRKHWRTLSLHYARASQFRQLEPMAAGWYARAATMRHLTDINEYFIRSICEVLGITTTLRRSSEFALSEGRNERLVEMCVAAGATRYLSGPSARGYLDETAFEAAGVSVEWMDYDGYAEYPQLHPPFAHGVSILDLLFNAGAAGRRFLKVGREARHARA